MMNIRSFLTLLTVCTSACAELPQVSGNNPDAQPNSAVAAQPAASAMNDYERMKRIEQLQSEVQQLTGKVEEQAFQVEELKKRQKTMYTDFDERLQALENKSGVSSAGSGDVSGRVATEPTVAGAAASVAEPSVATPEAKIPESAAPTPPTESAEPIKPATVQGGQSPVSKPPASQPVAGQAQISDAEKKEYQQAYDALRNGRSTDAISQFNTYLNTHKDSAYASNAQYWLGEAHRVNQDNVSARTAFTSVVEKYPASEKVPDSLLKLGYIEKDEKNIPKAREYLMRVINEYPNSKAAKIAQKKMPMLEKTEATH